MVEYLSLTVEKKIMRCKETRQRAGIQSGKLLSCQWTELSVVWSYLPKPGAQPELPCTVSTRLLLQRNPWSHCPWAQPLLLDSLAIQRTKNSRHTHPGLQARSQEVLVGIWADGTLHWGSGPVAWLSSWIHRRTFHLRLRFPVSKNEISNSRLIWL